MRTPEGQDALIYILFTSPQAYFQLFGKLLNDDDRRSKFQLKNLNTLCYVSR